ncbi:unnamed protein product [Closterium sp. NIES-65]|nr:unnamed protein product [Closterium sp. NIES-65]
MGGRWWRAVVGRLSLMQRGKAPLRYSHSRNPWQGGRAGGAKGVAGAEGVGGAEHMGAQGGAWTGGVAPGRGGGWGSLLVACAAGAAGCAVVEMGVEKGKEAAGVMADAWRQMQGDWLLLRVECADVVALSASIKSDDSESFLKNRESGGDGGAGGAGGGNERNGSSSVVASTSSEITGGKSSGGVVGRKRVVVLGSGWGAVSFLKAIDAHGYDVTLISPRNFFLFTPLLPSVTTGVVEGRSIAEPIRRILLRHGSSARFLEAECIAIDPASRTLSCRAPAALPAAALPAPLPVPAVAKAGGQKEGDGARGEGGGECGGAREVHFSVPYDMLVVAVGAVPNTFNVPGVQQHCHFLKASTGHQAWGRGTGRLVTPCTTLRNLLFHLMCLSILPIIPACRLPHLSTPSLLVISPPISPRHLSPHLSSPSLPPSLLSISPPTLLAISPPISPRHLSPHLSSPSPPHLSSPSLPPSLLAISPPISPRHLPLNLSSPSPPQSLLPPPASRHPPCQSLDDAEAIRNTLIDCFEAASLPGIEAEEQHRLLHVVVVGGGPTGVEVAAAVHDMVQGDLYHLYPTLKGKASVSLLQSGDHILNMFDLRISEFAARKFQRDGITVHTHARVTAVTPRALHVRETSSSRESGSSDGSKSGVHGRSSAESSSGGKSSGEREVPYGVVVWATGITAHPLVVKLREQLGQVSFGAGTNCEQSGGAKSRRQREVQYAYGVVVWERQASRPIPSLCTPQASIGGGRVDGSERGRQHSHHRSLFPLMLPFPLPSAAPQASIGGGRVDGSERGRQHSHHRSLFPLMLPFPLPSAAPQASIGGGRVDGSERGRQHSHHRSLFPLMLPFPLPSAAPQASIGGGRVDGSERGRQHSHHRSLFPLMLPFPLPSAAPQASIGGGRVDGSEGRRGGQHVGAGRLCCHSPPPLHDCAAIHHRPFTTVLPFTTAPSRLCCHSPPPLHDCAAIHHRPFTTVLPFTTAPSRLCCHSPPPLHDCAAIHHRPFTTVLPFTTAPSRLCCHSPPPLHDCAAIHHRRFTTVLPFTTAPSRLCCHSPPPLHDCAAIHHRPFTTVLPFTTAPSRLCCHSPPPLHDCAAIHHRRFTTVRGAAYRNSSSLSLVSDSYCRPFPCTLSSPLSPPSPLSPRSPPPPPPPFSPLPHPPLHVPSRRASVFPPLSPTATPRPTPRMIIVRAGRGSSHIPYSRLLPCPSMPRPVSHVTTLLLSLCGQDDTARIFRAFDTNGDGCLSPSETKAALRALQQRYPHAAALLRSRDRMAQLVQVHPCPFSCCHPVSESKTTPGALAGCIARGQQGRSTARHRGAPPGTGELGNEGGEQQACEGRELSLEQFEAVLRRVEGQMKTLPATAQVAAQQGQYVARCFNRLLDPGLTPEGPLKLRGEGRHLLQPFRYVHLGQFAPLGSETMAAELPGDWVSIGRSTQWLWYSVYARWV